MLNSIEHGSVDLSLDYEGIPRWMLSRGNSLGKILGSIEGKPFEDRPFRQIGSMNIWSKPYVIRQSNGERMCVLVMETERWHCNDEFDGRIMSLSCLLSSYMLFHVRYIHSEVLKCLSNPFKLNEDESNTMGEKLLQHLDILIYDYEGYYRKRDDVEKGIEMSKERLKRMQNDKYEAPIAKKIEDSFDEFDVFCFPHPGEDVMDLYYDGTISDIKPQFMRIMSYYINRIIQGIHPRVMGDVCITGRNFVG